MKYILTALVIFSACVALADVIEDTTVIAQCRQIANPNVSGAKCTLSEPGWIYLRKKKNLGYEVLERPDWPVGFENSSKCPSNLFASVSGCVFSKDAESPYIQCKEDSRYIHMKSEFGNGSTPNHVTEATYDKQTKQLRLKLKNRHHGFFWQKYSDFVLQCEEGPSALR